MKKYKILNVVSALLVVILATSTVILSVLLAQKDKEAREYSYVERKLEMFEFENRLFAKEQIVFIGDSITDLCVLDDYYNELPFATYNRGIGGDTTKNILNRLKVSLFDLQPSKVVLLIGVNDINSNVAEDKLLANYRSILNEITINLPQAEVFCMSILPMNKTVETSAPIDVDKNNQIIMEINPKIEGIVHEFGYEFVNLFPSFADSNNCLIEQFSDDGLHLNHNGFVAWSNILKPMLV